MPISKHTAIISFHAILHHWNTSYFKERLLFKITNLKTMEWKMNSREKHVSSKIMYLANVFFSHIVKSESCLWMSSPHNRLGTFLFNTFIAPLNWYLCTAQRSSSDNDLYITKSRAEYHYGKKTASSIETFFCGGRLYSTYMEYTWWEGTWVIQHIKAVLSFVNQEI